MSSQQPVPATVIPPTDRLEERGYLRRVPDQAGRRPRRSQPLTQARNPSRQLAYRGTQPSSFLAFWFEDPRELVI